MKDSESQEHSSDQTRKHAELVKELVREAVRDIAGIRATTAGQESLDAHEWRQARLFGHNLAARAQALNLGVLANCARELERFAGVVVSGEPHQQSNALQSAAIAIETIDLELSVLSQREGSS